MMAVYPIMKIMLRISGTTSDAKYAPHKSRGGFASIPIHRGSVTPHPPDPLSTEPISKTATTLREAREVAVGL